MSVYTNIINIHTTHIYYVNKSFILDMINRLTALVKIMLEFSLYYFVLDNYIFLMNSAYIKFGTTYTTNYVKYFIQII